MEENLNKRQNQNNVVAEALQKTIVNSAKKYAVMLYYTERDLGISENPSKFVLHSIYKTNSGAEALALYASTKCPASQIIDAYTNEDLDKEIFQMMENYKSEEWLNEHVWPYM